MKGPLSTSSRMVCLIEGRKRKEAPKKAPAIVHAILGQQDETISIRGHWNMRGKHNSQQFVSHTLHF